MGREREETGDESSPATSPLPLTIASPDGQMIPHNKSSAMVWLRTQHSNQRKNAGSSSEFVSCCFPGAFTDPCGHRRRTDAASFGCNSWAGNQRCCNNRFLPGASSGGDRTSRHTNAGIFGSGSRAGHRRRCNSNYSIFLPSASSGAHRTSKPANATSFGSSNRPGSWRCCINRALAGDSLNSCLGLGSHS